MESSSSPASSVPRSSGKRTKIRISADSELPMDVYPIAACWKQSNGISFCTATSDDIQVKDYKVHKKARSSQVEIANISQSSEKEDEDSKDTDDSMGSINEGTLFSDVKDHLPSTFTCQVERHTFTGESDPVMPASYMLGVLDRKTGQLRLVPFADMFPRMAWTSSDLAASSDLPASPDRDFVTPPRDEVATQPSGSTGARASQFSAPVKRKKKKDEKAEEGFHTDIHRETANITPMADGEEEVDVAALMVKPSEADMNLEIGTDIRARPNIEAKLPQNLYDWDLILPPDSVTAALLAKADELLAASLTDLAKWRQTNRFSQHFLAVLDRVLRNKKDNEDGALMRVANMLLVNYLLHLFNHRDRPMRDKELLPAEAPPEAAKYLIDNFTEPAEFVKGKWIVTEKIKDKILARIILVVLTTDKFTADVSAIIAPLSPKDRARFQNITSICGGKFLDKSTRGRYTYLVTLCTPWQFPKVSTGNTPKKRKRN